MATVNQEVEGLSPYSRPNINGLQAVQRGCLFLMCTYTVPPS